MYTFTSISLRLFRQCFMSICLVTMFSCMNTRAQITAIHGDLTVEQFVTEFARNLKSPVAVLLGTSSMICMMHTFFERSRLLEDRFKIMILGTCLLSLAWTLETEFNQYDDALSYNIMRFHTFFLKELWYQMYFYIHRLGMSLGILEFVREERSGGDGIQLSALRCFITRCALLGFSLWQVCGNVSHSLNIHSVRLALSEGIAMLARRNLGFNTFDLLRNPWLRFDIENDSQAEHQYQVSYSPLWLGPLHNQSVADDVDHYCPICHSSTDEKLLSFCTSLRHGFHKECIAGWAGRGADVCPICRAPLERTRFISWLWRVLTCRSV